MLSRDDLDDDGIYFMKCHIEKLADLLNMVIRKEIKPQDILLLMWLASYAWKDPRKKRNPCKIPAAQLAEAFEVSERSIERRLSNLIKAGLVKNVYRYKGKDGKIKKYKRSQSTWDLKKKKGGRIMHAFHYVLDETFIVKTGKDEEQTYPENSWVLKTD